VLYGKEVGEGRIAGRGKERRNGIYVSAEMTVATFGEYYRKGKLFLANGVLLRYNFKVKSHIQDGRQHGFDGIRDCLECGSLFLYNSTKILHFFLAKDGYLHYNINYRIIFKVVSSVVCTKDKLFWIWFFMAECRGCCIS
jgi:hypothetical protein